MPKANILVTRLIPEAALRRLEEVFALNLHKANTAMPRAELLARLSDADALLCLLTDAIDREALDAAPRLKCVSNLAVGYNNIDLDYATQKGIAVCNTPGVLTETTADLTWALILACARRIPESDRLVRSGGFTGWEPLLMLGNDVYGKTLGIIGLGRIGLAVARRSEGFGMRVMYHDPRVDPVNVPAAYASVSLHHLCREADFISVHVPLLPESRHLLGPEEFALMKPSAVLVNSSRGPVLDETALINALREGRIFAVGLDVYEYEPRIPPELLELENVVLLPHIGSASHETRAKMALLAAENAIAVIEGCVPPSQVN